MGKMIQAAIALMLTATPVAAMSNGGDPDKGKNVYKKCKACHVVDEAKNKFGPHLLGLFGRPAGSVEGYKYSPALKAKGAEGLVWDAETLDAFLLKPRSYIPKTKMGFPGLKKESDRKNILAYLLEATKKPE